MRILVIIPILALFLGINFYIGWHGFIWLDSLGAGVPLAPYWIVFTIIAFSYLLGRLPLPRPIKPVGRLLKVMGSYYFAVLEFAVLLLPIADVIYLVCRLTGADTTDFVPIAGTVVVIVLALLIVWGSRNAWSTVVRNYELAIDKKAGELRQLRVAVASDLHLGNIVGNRHLKKLVDRMNAMEPDLILLPGDVLDDSIEPFIRNEMSRVLGGLKARHGVYAVLGNHEYYGGHIEEYVETMSSIGIKVLRDETVEVAGSLTVAGRKDRTAESMDPDRRVSVEKLLESVDVQKPVFLIDHQPYHFDKAAAAGVDLLLCGHTHRGQFAPNHWITRKLFELDWGYLRKGAMHVVVSSGYGTWGPPIRLASRSEIIQLEITFAGES